MARLCVEIPDELDKRFRVKVAEIYGGKKGKISEAVAEAIRLWLEEKSKQG